MKKIKGLYVEDDKDNVKIYSKAFELADFDIEIIPDLPKDIEQYYNFILKEEIDFLIIDYHLNKQAVKYTGFDVLKEVRKNDSTMFAILLTNDDLDEAVALSEYDYALNKSEFIKESDILFDRIKRACSLRNENELIKPLNDDLQKKLEIESRTIDLLEEIKSMLM